MSIRKGSVYIAGNNISIDGDTISYNSNNSLQSVGNINKNIAVGSVDKLFDWVGTTAQYIAQDVETLHPEWICYITDDQGTGVGAVYNTTQADARFFKKNDDTDSITISSLSMPSDRYETVTLLASGNTYTATANGLFAFKMKCSSAGATKTVTLSSVSGTYTEYIVITNNMQGKNQYMNHWVKAGDVITISWDSGALATTGSELTFIYAEGNPTNP